MSKETSRQNYKLTIPLDASAVAGRKPEHAVKVAVQDRQGKIHSQNVQFDTSGHATAAFTFPENPGTVRVIVGPENASDEELLGLQTISLTTRWQAERELALPPITISDYYWRWWLIWCRTFTVHGRVLCADGSPVPGAVVCAYDVDWWWWWISKQQVGNCATTDATGPTSTEILADGVGCESCHGPSEKWRTTHYQASWKALDADTKFRDGLFPTKDLARRIGRCAECHVPALSFMDNQEHDLKLERFYEIGHTVNGMVILPDGPIKTFTLRAIKDSPTYLHDGRLMTLADCVEFFNLVLGLKLTPDEKDSLVAYMLAL